MLRMASPAAKHVHDVVFFSVLTSIFSVLTEIARPRRARQQAAGMWYPMYLLLLFDTAQFRNQGGVGMSILALDPSSRSVCGIARRSALIAG